MGLRRPRSVATAVKPFIRALAFPSFGRQNSNLSVSYSLAFFAMISVLVIPTLRVSPSLILRVSAMGLGIVILRLFPIFTTFTGIVKGTPIHVTPYIPTIYLNISVSKAYPRYNRDGEKTTGWGVAPETANGENHLVAPNPSSRRGEWEGQKRSLRARRERRRLRGT